MKHQKKKDFLFLATKLIEQIPSATTAKQSYKSYLKRKSTKLVKRSKIITQQPNIFENPKNVDKRSVTIEHP